MASLVVVAFLSIIAMFLAWAAGLLWCDTFCANGLGAGDYDG